LLLITGRHNLYFKLKVNHFCILNCIDIFIIVYLLIYKPTHTYYIVFAGELYHDKDMREIIIYIHI